MYMKQFSIFSIVTIISGRWLVSTSVLTNPIGNTIDASKTLHHLCIYKTRYKKSGHIYQPQVDSRISKPSTLIDLGIASVTRASKSEQTQVQSWESEADKATHTHTPAPQEIRSHKTKKHLLNGLLKFEASFRWWTDFFQSSSGEGPIFHWSMWDWKPLVYSTTAKSGVKYCSNIGSRLISEPSTGLIQQICTKQYGPLPLVRRENVQGSKPSRTSEF